MQLLGQHATYYGIEYTDGVQMLTFRHPILDREVCIMNNVPNIEGDDINTCTNEQYEHVKKANGYGDNVTINTLWNYLPKQKSTENYVTVVQERIKWKKAQEAMKAHMEHLQEFLMGVIPPREYTDREACLQTIKTILIDNPEFLQLLTPEDENIIMEPLIDLALKFGVI